MSVHPAPRVGSSTKIAKGGSVLRPEPGMKPGQLVACSVSLVVAGLLLTRGFIGFNPGRPLFLVLGAVLAASATVGLAIDHVRIRTSPERPLAVFAAELSRSRRYGHALAVLAIDCDDFVAERIVGSMRTTDRAWRHHGLRVLLPETDWDGVHGFAARIEAQVPSSHIRAAVFPDDALTLEGLERAMVPIDDTPSPATGPKLVPAPDDRAVGEG